VAHFFEQFVGEEIIEEGFIGVGVMEDPIGFGGEAEEGEFEVITEGVIDFEVIGFFGEAGGGLAADFGLAEALELWGGGGEVGAAAEGIDGGDADGDADILGYGAAEAIDDEDGEVGAERLGIGVGECVVEGEDRTGEEVRFEGADLEEGATGDGDG
jgi:hypothetical protein